MTWPVSLVVFGSMAALFAMSFLQWTGRWRSWYRPNAPIIFGLGSSPLLVPALLGGVLLMVGLIDLSSAVHERFLIGVGIAFGVAGIVIAFWIGFAEPRWSLPFWMRERRTRSGRHTG
jgi:hypothetical protein